MWRPILCAIVLALGAASAVADDGARYALVIGFNESDDGKTERLQYADDDAVATHLLLRDAGVHSVLLTTLDTDSHQLHTNIEVDGPPTLALIQEHFARLAEKMRSDQSPELLIFYSGHGNVEYGEGYVVLAGGRLTRTGLYELLGKSPAAQNHVIVDACKSYYLAFGKGPGGDRQAYRQHFVEEPDHELLARTGFVLSTSSARDSHEWERFGAGVFSHEVRSALRGAADVNGDALVSYSEIGAFLRNANSTIANPRYRPDFVVRPPGDHPGNLDAAILRWSESSDTLALQPADGDAAVGHIYVEDSSGLRLADAHAGPETGVTLHLPPKRPLFVRQGDDAREWVVEDQGAVAVTQLQETSRPLRTKGALHLAFEALFSAPFQPDEVATYTATYRAGPDPFVATNIEPPDTTRQTVQQVALWSGAGALAVGVGTNLWAWERKQAGEGKPHRRRTQLNNEIKVLDGVAIAAYSLAGVALVTWLGAEFLPDGFFNLGVSPTPGGVGVTFGGNVP